MNREQTDEYNNFLKDVKDGKVHGLGIGCSESSEQLAAQYLMRGFGEYKPDEIDKVLVPDIEKIIVKKFGNEPVWSDEFGLEWGVDVLFIGKDGQSEHFEYYFRCTGHGGSL